MTRHLTASGLALALSLGTVGCQSGGASPAAPAAESAQAPAAQPASGKMSVLAPANLKKARPAAPFDVTGNWFIDNSPGIQGWLFGPATIPKLKPEAQKHRDAYLQAIKEGKVYRDDIGQCWPAGVPIIMTRVWPIAMVQQIDYPSRAALEEAIRSPIRERARAVTLELMEMFDGRFYHLMSGEDS